MGVTLYLAHWGKNVVSVAEKVFMVKCYGDDKIKAGYVTCHDETT